MDRLRVAGVGVRTGVAFADGHSRPDVRDCGTGYIAGAGGHPEWGIPLFVVYCVGRCKGDILERECLGRFSGYDAGDYRGARLVGGCASG